MFNRVFFNIFDTFDLTRGRESGTEAPSDQSSTYDIIYDIYDKETFLLKHFCAKINQNDEVNTNTENGVRIKKLLWE